ncbi:MAG: hypothetical protein Aurels2KO_09990 [Aureliella sp.]
MIAEVDQRAQILGSVAVGGAPDFDDDTGQERAHGTVDWVSFLVLRSRWRLRSERHSTSTAS